MGSSSQLWSWARRARLMITMAPLYLIASVLQKQSRSQLSTLLPGCAAESRGTVSDLEHIAFAGDDFVEDRVDEEAEDQARNQSGNHDDSERFLRVTADAGGHGGGKQAEAGDERGHHDGAKAKERGFERGVADAFAFETKFVDIADEDDGGLDGDAEQRQQTQDAGDADGCVRKLEGDERTDGLSQDDPESDGDGELEVAVEREENHEDKQKRERTDDPELRLGFEQLAVFTAPIQVIALGKRDGFFDGGLAGVNGSLEVAALHGKLNADVARIVFTIDEGRTSAFLDAGELGQRDLLARGSGNEEIADVSDAGAVLRLHAND